MPDLSRVSCAYCNRRAHTTAWEGDALVPVCKDHSRTATSGHPDRSESVPIGPAQVADSEASR